MATADNNISNNCLRSFVSAFRGNLFLRHQGSTLVDEYITAGAFILLSKRSSISPSDYQSWILYAVLLAWINLEDSFEIADVMERIFGKSKNPSICKNILSLAGLLKWNVHLSKDEIEQMVDDMKKNDACDILRVRTVIPLLH